MLFAYLHTCPGFVSSLSYGVVLHNCFGISMPRESTKGEVINVRSDLAIMVSVKPNTWLTIEELTLSTIQRLVGWLVGWCWLVGGVGGWVGWLVGLVGWLVGCEREFNIHSTTMCTTCCVTMAPTGPLGQHTNTPCTWVKQQLLSEQCNNRVGNTCHFIW